MLPKPKTEYGRGPGSWQLLQPLFLEPRCLMISSHQQSEEGCSRFPAGVLRTRVVIFLRDSSAAGTRCFLTGRLREGVSPSVSLYPCNERLLGTGVASLPLRPCGFCPAYTLSIPSLPVFLPTIPPLPSASLSLHPQLEDSLISLTDIFPSHRQGINLSSCLENEKEETIETKSQAPKAGLGSRHRVGRGAIQEE